MNISDMAYKVGYGLFLSGSTWNKAWDLFNYKERDARVFDHTDGQHSVEILELFIPEILELFAANEVSVYS